MLWTYAPDWQTPILERLEWKTDVIPNYNGSEQRIALRQLPRRSIEFAFLVDGDRQRRELEVKLWSNGAKAWDVPIWTDTAYTAANIAAGTNSVPVQTGYYDFVIGNKVLLRACTGRYHLAVIANIYPNSLTLTHNLVDSWDIETAVIPVRTGYLDTSQQVTRFKGDTVYDNIRFEFEDNTVITPESLNTVYRGHPVITQASDWQQDLTLQYQRKMQELDFECGKYRDDETGQPALIHSHYWTLDSRENIHRFKQFLYARRGRLTACWLPSFLNDLQLIDPVVSGSSQINIEHCSYTELYQFKKNRRDIRIELQDGAVFYRRIVASSEVSSTVEQLTIDSPILQDIAPDDVVRISFMTFSRLSSDTAELSWAWSDMATVAANWMSTNDDV